MRFAKIIFAVCCAALVFAGCGPGTSEGTDGQVAKEGDTVNRKFGEGGKDQ